MIIPSQSRKYTWILVMNGSRARIIRGLGGKDDDCQEELVIRSDHPQLKEILADRQGRSFPPGGGGRRAAMAFGSDPLQHDLHMFLEKVVTLLETHRLAGDLRTLIAFADPSILGELRKTWSPQLRDIVSAEVPKNIVSLSAAEIQKRAIEAATAY